MSLFFFSRPVLSIAVVATLSTFGNALADVDVSGGVRLYGLLDQGLQSQALTNPYTSAKADYQGLFASNGTSRLGVKASRDLGEGIKGIAQAEIELAPDSSTLLPSSNRQAFVGFENASSGPVLLGTIEITAYEVWGMGANGRVEYKPQVWRTLASVALQDRANNAIKYISPAFSGFTAHL
ncbi:MAG: porin [Limnohabitans sp.]|nr:porin [Limnohabitans sp.]